MRSHTVRRPLLHARDTFAARGRRLGLSEDLVIEALCRAITVAGPAVGGRFVGPLHPIGDDETSRIAIEELEALAELVCATPTLKERVPRIPLRGAGDRAVISCEARSSPVD